MANIVTVELDERTAARLRDIAGQTGRTLEAAAADAVQTYVDLSAWEIAEIEASMREDDRGEYASEEEVAAVFNRYKL